MGKSKSESPVLFGLVGAGGFGRTVMPLALEQLNRQFSAQDLNVVFIETSPKESIINGVSCLSIEDFFNTDCEQRLFNVAIADSKLRESISRHFVSEGAEPISLHDLTSKVGVMNSIDVGGIFCHMSTVTVNARIGSFFNGHMYSYVEHDCVIGDYVTFAPRVSCNGNVHIGDHAYIGTGAVIRQGNPDKPLIIGEGAVVGMGAVVTKDVEPFTTVVGNPARVLKT